MSLNTHNESEMMGQAMVMPHQQVEAALRDLGGRLIVVQEEERRRIARELHDDLNQRIALLSIELEQLAQTIPKRQSHLRASIRYLWAKTQEISSDIHRLAYQLHPAKLDHLGLERAVKRLCAEMAKHHGCKIEFQHRGFPATLPKEMALGLYRVAQESLSNVVKHSGSEEARVVLERTEQSLCLSVSDVGCGFDTESGQTQSGLGFISMRERVRSVGGNISIRSKPSLGTQILVWIPLTGFLEET